MKRLLILTVLLLLPAYLDAHPGKTDIYGGHKCYKGCEEWGLGYAEYHLHDKEGRPIRVKKGAQVSAASPSIIPDQTPVITSSLVTTVTRTVVEYRPVTRVAEENIFPFNPFLYILLVLLLMLLILRMNRRKEEK